jgi:hypothetical protein
MRKGIKRSTKRYQIKTTKYMISLGKLLSNGVLPHLTRILPTMDYRLRRGDLYPVYGRPMCVRWESSKRT